MTFLFSFLTLISSIFSQNEKTMNDPKAKLLLDDISKTYKTYKCIEAKVSLTTELPQGKTKVDNGTIYLKGEKYKILMTNQEIYCDQKSVWTYLKDINEVQINDFENNKDEITPSNIFTVYKNDYYYTSGGNEKIGTQNCSIIDLAPKTSKSYFKVRIWVDTNKNIKRLKVFDRNGTRYTYNVITFNTKTNLEDTFFKFDATKHNGVNIEDLRM